MTSVFAEFAEPTFGNKVVLGKAVPFKKVPILDTDPAVKFYTDDTAIGGVAEVRHKEYMDFSISGLPDFINAWDGQALVAGVPYAAKMEGESVTIEIAGTLAPAISESNTIAGHLAFEIYPDIRPPRPVSGIVLAYDNGVQVPCSYNISHASGLLLIIRFDGVFAEGSSIGFDSFCISYTVSV